MIDGLARESLAKTRYLALLAEVGHLATIQDMGLTIYKDLPIIDCSSDGIVTYICSFCEGQNAVLEIKCPTVLKN